MEPILSADTNQTFVSRVSGSNQDNPGLLKEMQFKPGRKKTHSMCVSYLIACERVVAKRMHLFYETLS